MKLIKGIAENLPLADQSVDCVVTSWTLCSVTDPRQALSEIRRVLKPKGMFSFAEHGLAPEARVRMWQHRLTPIWSCCGRSANAARGSRLFNTKHAPQGLPEPVRRRHQMQMQMQQNHRHRDDVVPSERGAGGATVTAERYSEAEIFPSLPAGVQLSGYLGRT